MDSDAVRRADALLAQFRRRWPDALAEIGGMQISRGDGSVAWPDWCWVPMAAVHAYVDAHGGSGVEIGRVAAMAAWRLGRGVYEVDDAATVQALDRMAAWTGGDAGRWASVPVPPAEDLVLPEWAVYLAVPPSTAAEVPGAPLGVFVHLEHDANTARPELRLVLDTDGQWDGLVPVPVYLDRPTLGRALADVQAVAAAVVAGAAGPDVQALAGAGPVAAVGGLLAYAVWPLLLATIDPAGAIHAPGLPGETPRPAATREGRWWPAKVTRLWRVGVHPDRPPLRAV
jgi:hypothetical protein